MLPIKKIVCSVGIVLGLWLESAAQQTIDVQHYTLRVAPDFATKSLSGEVEMRFTYKDGTGEIQLQLDSLLTLDKIINSHGQPLAFTRAGKQIAVRAEEQPSGSEGVLLLFYHGTPKVAKNAPWDGGLVWRQSKGGLPWLGVACQEDGASIWWPCKDDLADEPEEGVSIYGQAPIGLKAICNGSLADITPTDDGTANIWHWEVTSPINLYNVTLNIGNYARVQEVIPSSTGSFTSTVWLLKEDSAKGFPYLLPRIKQMFDGYQALFGDYPWQKDGYQLVQTDYWGMEHQSCVAYGNHFKPDPFGLDFILIHETGHEWWGNQISVADNADLWVHEAFCTYAEVLLCERLYGQEAAKKYQAIQLRKIKNLSPLQGPKGVHYHGWKDADIYYRGAGLLNTLRVMTGDSTKYIKTLQAILQEHKHKPASTESVIHILSNRLGVEKAELLKYALNLPTTPVIEVWKQRRGVYEYRLPGYTGPTLSLGPMIDLDGNWHTLHYVPEVPKGWLMVVKEFDTKPRH